MGVGESEDEDDDGDGDWVASRVACKGHRRGIMSVVYVVQEAESGGGRRQTEREREREQCVA